METITAWELYNIHEPLLCNDREIGKYTTPVSRQQLGKHVPVARQQILTLQQGKSCVFYVVRAEML
jgi:hypothetical protein